MKKFGSILLALVIVLSMAVALPAFAANDGSITVKNATIGKDYAGYKVLDATFTTSPASVAYSIVDTSQWYAAVSGAGSPFALTLQVGSTDTYNVAVKSGLTDSDVIAWMKTLLPDNTKTPSLASKTATSSTVAWTGIPYGYYLITSALGTIVTVDSNLSDVVIIDKNQTPGWNPPDPDNPPDENDPNYNKNGKFVAEAASGPWGKESTASISDTAYFMINSFAPAYTGAKRVIDYTFTDTLSAGFTYNAASLAVTLNGTALTEGANNDYTLDVSGQTITVVLHAYAIAGYPAEADVSITYSAKVDKDAVYENENTVAMDWTVTDPYNPNPNAPEDPTDHQGDPAYPQPPTDSTTNTYVYGFNLQKYHTGAGEGNKLLGAEFRLYDALTGGSEIPVVEVSAGVYRVAEATETGVAIKAGAAKIFGLAVGTYYLEETVAPAGFNKLVARVPIVITDALADDDGYLTAEQQVINLTGVELPSTGGIGTTIFYVIGGLLVGAAVVLLIVRKRMSAGK